MSAPATFDLVVTGDVVLPERIVENGVIAVSDGRIAGLFAPGSAPQAMETREYPGRLVLPGLVDTHVHAGSFDVESITTTTAAAAAGGVTTIVDMPYDRGAPVMGIERLEEKIATVGEQALVDVGLYGSMPKVDGVEVLDAQVAGGVCAFKFSLYEYDPDRFPRIADGDLLDAFERLAESGVPIVLHNELQEIVEYRLARLVDSDRAGDPLVHGLSRPPVTETAASVKALDFAYWTGARLHLAHCTHPHTFRLIDWYRELGAAVSGETCAHYLALSERDVVRLGPLAKVNPPIRDETAREALWAQLREGKIATVSTDHAPWPLETKQRPILEASAGAPGLETFLPSLLTGGLERGLPLPDLLAYATSRPAELFGVGDRKGRIALGMDADLAVFDAREPATYHAADSQTNAGWSPFDGHEFCGRVEATFVRGKQVYDDGRVLAAPGDGRWVARAT